MKKGIYRIFCQAIDVGLDTIALIAEKLSGSLPGMFHYTLLAIGYRLQHFSEILASAPC